MSTFDSKEDIVPLNCKYHLTTGAKAKSGIVVKNYSNSLKFQIFLNLKKSEKVWPPCYSIV